MGFIEIDEMRSVLYHYQIDEITEQDTTITLMAINSAVSECKSYLNPSNQKQWDDGRQKYDISKIFSAKGDDRDPLILEICKDIAAWRVVRLCNADVIYSHVRERYNSSIDWLTKVANGTVNPNLPTIDENEEGNEDSNKLPFRYGSRTKFRYN